MGSANAVYSNLFVVRQTSVLQTLKADVLKVQTWLLENQTQICQDDI